MTPPRIFLIAGSAEKLSYVRTSLNILVDIFRDLGAQPHLWDLAEHLLPLFTLDESATSQREEMAPVQEFIQLADQADAFVLGSPVYHNSFSGMLKNALDTLSPGHFYHKPVALVSNGYSDRTANLPCEHLRSVVRGLTALAIPSQMVTVPADFLAIDEQYVLTNTLLLERFSLLAKELLYFTEILRNTTSTQPSFF